MPCYSPIAAFAPLDGGQILFSEKKGCREIKIPCGGCIGCRLEKQDAWAFRCMAEAQMHKHNYFITLTYDDDHYPVDESLDHRDWQLFAKRLRERAGPFRFFMCGEYGENTQRAHFHALLFGCELPDLVKSNSVQSVRDLFESELLRDVWGKGFATVGFVTPSSARYVASYTLKRCSDELAKERYTWCTRFGEIVQRKQPYGKMSLKPGIGAEWLYKYRKDVQNHGAVYENQFKKKIPQYFRTLIEKIDPRAAEDLEVKVQQYADLVDPNEFTRERLSVKNVCANARITFKKERFSNAL